MKIKFDDLSTFEAPTRKLVVKESDYKYCPYCGEKRDSKLHFCGNGKIGDPDPCILDVQSQKFDKVLSEGIQLYAITIKDGARHCLDDPDVAITRMEVTMEAGQAGRVPWVAVYHDDRLLELYNCAHLESVEFKTQRER